MAEATVGALRVTLGADTAKFEEGLNRAEGALAGFGGAVTKIASGIGLEKAVERSIEALKELFNVFREGILRIAEFGSAAQVIGATIEEFSKFRLAASLVGINIEGMSAAIGQLSKHISDAAKGTGEARNTFQALHIEIRKGNGDLKTN